MCLEEQTYVIGFDPDMIFRIPALLITLTIHEYAHARTAVALGDPTPRVLGRLTLNPIAHLDPMGLIMMWLFKFGWAKPVPINPGNFRDGKRGTILVFNLLPLPPLDGSKVVSSLLPGRQSYAFERLEPYGPWILLALVYLGVIGIVTRPLEYALSNFINAIIGLIF